MFFSLIVCSTCLNLMTSCFLRTLRAANLLSALCLTRWTRPKEPVPRVAIMFKSPIVILSFFSAFCGSDDTAAAGFLVVPKSDAAALGLVTFEAAVGDAGSAAVLPIEGRNFPSAESSFNGLFEAIIDWFEVSREI